MNPFSDASILGSLRLKLKGACYKKSGAGGVPGLTAGTKKIDVRSYFPHTQGDTATLAELKTMVRRELKLSPQFVPDAALAKLVAYIASPLAAAYTPTSSPAGSPRGSSGVVPDGERPSSSPPRGGAPGVPPGGGAGKNIISSTLDRLMRATGGAVQQTVFSVAELQRFVQRGDPSASEKAEVGRVMARKKAERCVRKFQVGVSCRRIVEDDGGDEFEGGGGSYGESAVLLTLEVWKFESVPTF